MALYILLLPVHSISQLAALVDQGAAFETAVMCHADGADQGVPADGPSSPDKPQTSGCPICQAGTGYSIAFLEPAVTLVPALEANAVFARPPADIAADSRAVTPRSRGPPRLDRVPA